MRPLTSTVAGLIVLAVSAQVQGALLYVPAPATNSDGATLDSGFFQTDGTLGTGLALGPILQDYSITITENSTTITLTPSNSSIDFDSAIFDITTNSIATHTGSTGVFRIVGNPSGFYVVNDSDNDASINVSADNAGAANNLPNPLTVATNAVPEPTSLALLVLVSLGFGASAPLRKQKRLAS